MIPVLHGVWAASAELLGYEHIETQTVGAGGAASVTFSSIPSTYKHLELRIQTRPDWGTIRFNGDTTTSNYRLHYLRGDGASATSGTTANNAYFPYSGNATYPYVGVMQILDYTSTSKYKTCRSLEGFDVNGSGGSVFFISTLWMSTSAITSIVITGNSSFSQYSSFSLYGVK